MVALGRLLAQKFDIQFVPDNSQIHCLAHVVNLVVQKMLAVLEEADDPDVVDYYLSNKDLPFHYDPDTDAELRDLEDEQFVYKDEEAEEAANTEAKEESKAKAEVMEMMATEYENLSALHKLRLIVTKICSSPQRRRSFKIIAAKMYKDTKAPSGRKLSTLMVIRDVKHRWNFMEAMISRGKLLRKVCQCFFIKNSI
ncbi:hypothetical protein K438DRAFT_1033042 [Mycena galopus ATCC 62051]|nr:hypothetical protein K438DRAFT_1033042 [Mycena galopus ATCC 62051]